MIVWNSRQIFISIYYKTIEIHSSFIFKGPIFRFTKLNTWNLHSSTLFPIPKLSQLSQDLNFWKMDRLHRKVLTQTKRASVIRSTVELLDFKWIFLNFHCPQYVSELQITYILLLITYKTSFIIDKTAIELTNAENRNDIPRQLRNYSIFLVFHESYLTFNSLCS